MPTPIHVHCGDRLPASAAARIQSRCRSRLNALSADAQPHPGANVAQGYGSLNDPAPRSSLHCRLPPLPACSLFLLRPHAPSRRLPPQLSRAVDPDGSPPPPPDRASAYYHDGLAHLYEELAVNNGRPDYAVAGDRRVQARPERRPRLEVSAGWPRRPLLQDRPHSRGRHRRAGSGQEGPGRHRSAHACWARSICVRSAICRARRRARCCSLPSPSTKSSPS